jgi:hypothetical protein
MNIGTQSTLNTSTGFDVKRSQREEPDTFTLKVNPQAGHVANRVQGHGCGKKLGELWCGYLQAYKEPMERLYCLECREAKKKPTKKTADNIFIKKPVFVWFSEDKKEVRFDSIADAARFLCVHDTTVHAWLTNRGGSSDGKYMVRHEGQEYRAPRIVSFKIQVGDMIFRSAMELAEHNGVSTTTVANWLKAGVTPDGEKIQRV